MEQKTKKRSQNWTAEEKGILWQLISQSAHIIENRSNKTNINVLKTKQWKILMNRFNEITGKSRSEEELKLAWKRMKLTAKSNLSVLRREQAKTDGGGNLPLPSPDDMAIMSITPHNFVMEFNNFDRDAAIPMLNKSSEVVNSKVIDSLTEIREAKPQLINMTERVKSEPVMIGDTEGLISTKKSCQNRCDWLDQAIVNSNDDFKKRQLEMMEVEHHYNVKIAELTIKKLELEIAVLENKNNSIEK